MTNLRFGLLAVFAFALAFIGFSWASKGFPVLTPRVAELKPDARIPTFEESVKRGVRKDWENSKTAQSDGDKQRDKLRIELLQASIGYKLSPCDDTMKKNLVSALTNYTTAWSNLMHCRPGVDGCAGSSDERIDAAAAAFKTPADVQVHKVLREAIRQGGVSREDFPGNIRNSVFMWSGAPFDDEQAACVAARRAENTRR